MKTFTTPDGKNLTYIIDKKGCFIWQKSKDTGGYGHLRYKGKNSRAHRVSWEINNGEIPEGLCVLHKCDVRDCINPDHLWLGSYKDNRRDCLSKNRYTSLKGHLNPNSKLKEEEVLKIRELAQSKTIREISKIFKISYPSCRRIIRKISWRHI